MQQKTKFNPLRNATLTKTNMKIKFLIILFPLLANHLSFSQKQGNNWYFGENAGLGFNSGKPVALTNSRMSVYWGGTATISNNNGQLLFYSNGLHVWDSTHSNFVSGLRGHDVNYQGALFVPHPDSTHLYFIFTSNGATTPNPDLYYSIINMKLRSGRGDILTSQKNISLGFPVYQKLTAVRHANRRDYWVVTQKFNSDSLFSYLISPYGISKTPVISQIYKPIFSTTIPIRGVLKLSPDGKRICSLNTGDSSFIADFDASTGKINNPWLFKDVSYAAIGLEYSAKSKYLYTVISGGPGIVYQYDLSANTKNEFLSSRTTIDSGFEKKQGMFNALLQLGPDGKIYIPVYGDDYLHVINNPDLEGLRCAPQRDYVYLGNKTTGGLPDMVQSFFQKKTFNVHPSCSRDTVFFNISNTYDLDSAHWDFGDTSSGINNFSNKTSNVFHIYAKTGSYKARLISYHKQFSDTIFEDVFLNYAKPFLGNDTSICNGNKLTLRAKGDYKSYLWNNVYKVKTLTISQKGTYFLTATDYDGCNTFDTIVVKTASIKANFSFSDSATCLGGNLLFKETSTYSGDKRRESIWYFNDTTINDSIVLRSFLNPGTHTIKLVSISQNNCQNTANKSITVWAKPNSEFQINDSDQCFNIQSFDFINKSSIAFGNLYFEWDLGDLTWFNKDFVQKTYKKSGRYSIRLIAISENYCTDTSIATVRVDDSPKSDFKWVSTCEFSPIPFTFTGTKPVPPIITSFNWDFAGEGNSNAENPTKLFGTSGNKSIRLILKSDNGCSDTIIQDVQVYPQAKAEFDVQDVCESDSANFTNKSVRGINFKWKFGDGNTSNVLSPKHMYKINGITKTFNVTLVAIVPNGCSDSITKAVTSNANPKSEFNFATSGKQVNFTALENGATNYQWTFGDGGTTNTSNINTQYTYSKFPSGKYTACLKVTNASGCFSETCKEVFITGANLQPVLPRGFKVYPNPNQGTFKVEGSEFKGVTKIEILNQVGQIIHSQEINQTQVINLNLIDGVYLIRVSSNGLIQSGKIFIQN